MENPAVEQNPLLEYLLNNPGRLIDKWVHYFDIYHRHLAHYRGEAVTLVEFGVLHGGSLQMWKRYLGPRAHRRSRHRPDVQDARGGPGDDPYR